jgi:hypothetical protein
LNRFFFHVKYRYSLKELKDGWYVFTLANAKTSDAGSYSCTATNSLGQASCVGKLTLFRMFSHSFDYISMRHFRFRIISTEFYEEFN